MSAENHFKFSKVVLLAPLLAALSIWTVFWIEVKFKVNLNEFGIEPRDVVGLRGIFFSPFIHGSIEHLYNNTIPLITLTAALFYFYYRNAIQVLLIGILLSGLLTWLIGRPSYHIGASGLIYVLVSFIFFKGIFAKHYRLIALSLAMVFLYGSMIWYIFPIKDGISWEGHLSGFLVGFLLALTYKTKLDPEKKYSWEKEDYNEEEDEFLKHFDEDGNFIETIEPPTEQVEINYHYKKENENRKD
ncbi:rhomboid family intramembrane serine protease [Croceitalea sp. MTPC9]|uniref:rhomboid family intramembrane serine protease n=1 Tax=unclassified Croceitalea TaxID=2632280 RepID=UPI002B3FE378|nr:rhomboid family intramembrane serine protease [Croceitalea sp. MTPC6]GMN17806.1 rhomboid family intramembrane serine protease [Croceitalea sp. MTPC9]